MPMCLGCVAQDVQVYCRKRPFNEKELAAKEFDVLSVGPGGHGIVIALLDPCQRFDHACKGQQTTAPAAALLYKLRGSQRMHA